MNRGNSPFVEDNNFYRTTSKACPFPSTDTLKHLSFLLIHTGTVYEQRKLPFCRGRNNFYRTTSTSCPFPSTDNLKHLSFLLIHNIKCNNKSEATQINDTFSVEKQKIVANKNCRENLNAQAIQEDGKCQNLIPVTLGNVQR
jgi:hypothetical protein